MYTYAILMYTYTGVSQGARDAMSACIVPDPNKRATIARVSQHIGTLIEYGYMKSISIHE
jgi:hypothetical protein